MRITELENWLRETLNRGYILVFTDSHRFEIQETLIGVGQFIMAEGDTLKQLRDSYRRLNEPSTKIH